MSRGKGGGEVTCGSAFTGPLKATVWIRFYVSFPLPASTAGLVKSFGKLCLAVAVGPVDH